MTWAWCNTVTTQSPITIMEQVVERAVNDIRTELDRMADFLGDRPLFRKKLSIEEQYDAYREMRAQPYAIWGMMNSVWQEIEGRLQGFSPEEREDLGVGPQATRELAMLEVLRHCDKMRRYELKLSARSEDTTPPPNW